MRRRQLRGLPVGPAGRWCTIAQTNFGADRPVTRCPACGKQASWRRGSGVQLCSCCHVAGAGVSHGSGCGRRQALAAELYRDPLAQSDAGVDEGSVVGALLLGTTGTGMACPVEPSAQASEIWTRCPRPGRAQLAARCPLPAAARAAAAAIGPPLLHAAFDESARRPRCQWHRNGFLPTPCQASRKFQLKPLPRKEAHVCLPSSWKPKGASARKPHSHHRRAGASAPLRSDHRRSLRPHLIVLALPRPRPLLMDPQCHFS